MDIKQGVQQVVQKLYDKHGEVKPTALVEAAKPKDSPAHGAFEWDDSRAGQEYRLMQARQWIRRVEIVYEDRTERLIHVPIIEDGKREKAEGYYKPISIVVQDKDEFELALEQVKSTFIAAKQSYDELKKAFNQIDVRKINTKQADRGFTLVESAIGV